MTKQTAKSGHWVKRKQVKANGSGARGGGIGLSCGGEDGLYLRMNMLEGRLGSRGVA